MDVTVVDATGLDGVRPGRTATLLGRDGGREISLREVAEMAGRIEYEVLTGLSRGLARVRTDEGGGPRAE
jgi:alanine racemase